VLYATFASPWADAPSTREPQYQLPMCYYIQPPALKTTHFNKFQLETLFYIFYAMPQDVLQVRDDDAMCLNPYRSVQL
jgi:CCR4-NOT transcription complex subunit 2